MDDCPYTEWDSKVTKVAGKGRTAKGDRTWIQARDAIVRARVNGVM